MWAWSPTLSRIVAFLAISQEKDPYAISQTNPDFDDGCRQWAS
jgi:hypothetical protein